jgi:hypothetical protein
MGANPNAIFPLEKNVNISSFNLLVTKAAQIGKAKGPANSQYIASSSLVKTLAKRGPNSATLDSKYTKDYKCPLVLAL